jgi:L-alanine-DL-glutamate epimerase-like enolase superfamily enzyme
MAAVPTIAALEADLFRIPLPVTLTDSTHGAMSDFELVTVRIEDSDGMTGLGYAYTVHVGGRAVHAGRRGLRAQHRA